MTATSTIRYTYGDDSEQFGELTLPGRRHGKAPVVMLVHGGFWRAHRTLDLMRPLARPLAVRGFAVWNLEYRRMGQAGGGWPGTLLDVAAGIDAVQALPARRALDLDRVVLVGHSAGGQLVLWATSRRPVPGADRPDTSPGSSQSPTDRPVHCPVRVRGQATGRRHDRCDQLPS